MMTPLMLLEEAHRWWSRKEGGGGTRGSIVPPNKNWGDRAPHIFCPQMTQEQPSL